MLARSLLIATLALGVPTTATLALLPRNDAGEAAFPQGFASGVLYASIDRVDTRQRLELFAPSDAVAAAKHGAALPDGTILTMLRYNAALDAAGNPRRDADGRFIKAELAGYSVMEKQRGRGAEHPPALRNGDWTYRRYTPAREIDLSVGETACLRCHKQQESHDFIFSRRQMTTIN